MSAFPKRQRAALYVRLSDDASHTRENVADQERACRQIAKRLDADVVSVYDDNDCPASDPKRKPRPAFDRMLADAAEGKFDLLIVRHADRLYRTPHDLGRIAEAFGPAKIVVHQEWSGHPLDLSTPTGLLNAGIMAQVAKYETDHKRERQKAKNRLVAAAGRVPEGGPTPFGYVIKQSDGERQWVPEPRRATMVRDAHQALLAGATLGSIIRAWNASDVKAPRGGHWTYATVRSALTRPLNAGYVVYGGEILPGVQGGWEPLVTAEEHHAVVELLSDPKRRTTDGNRRKHLLPGIARCGTCGRGMKTGHTTLRPRKRLGETERRKHYVLRCSNPACERPVTIAAKALTAEVERRFFEARGDLPALKVVTDVNHAARLADVDARIRGLTARLGEDDADMLGLLDRLAELKAERAREKAEPVRHQIIGGKVADEWHKAGDGLEGVARRRELLLGHLAPDGLRIAPRGSVTHRFDASRVEIEWGALPEIGPIVWTVGPGLPELVGT